jgi:ubiquinone/menaquinone biosynthesis C-methylase UbiE
MDCRIKSGYHDSPLSSPSIKLRPREETMATTDKVFGGSIPEIYDRHLVPLLFEPYALDLAGRVARSGATSILEIASGTGAVTRALAAALPKQARIVATDLNQPMLDRARTRQPDEHRIEWKQADALALPFADEAFDAVVCQFGAMFFPDKVQGYKEAHRVLKSGGHFFFNVWDKISTNEFADAVTEAVASMFPNDPPRFLARTPHRYNDADQIRRELSAAGFAKVAIEPLDRRSKAASPREAAFAYCEGTPLRNEIEARDAARLEDATNHAATAIARRFGNGAVDGAIRALIITATR